LLRYERRRKVLKKFLTFVVILLLVLSTFQIIAPAAKAEPTDSGIIEAEDTTRVERFGGSYYVGDPDGRGWMEKEQWVLKEDEWIETTVLFTIGQHHEKLRFQFTGTKLSVKYYCFRSGVFNISLVGEPTKYALVDTWSGDNWESIINTTLVFQDLEDKQHTVELEATGLRNPNTCAEYLYIDAFIYRENVDPSVQITSYPSRVEGLEAASIDFYASDSDGNITAWAVDFGDGTPWEWQTVFIKEHAPSLSKTVLHAYAEVACYRTVTVWVEDNSGARAKNQRQIEVYVLPDLTVNSWDIDFSEATVGIDIDVTVHNIGAATAQNFNVVILRRKTPRLELFQKKINSLAAQADTTFSYTWLDPVKATITVEVDCPVKTGGSVQEGDEENNDASREVPGNEPVITVITPYYDDTALPTTGFTAFRAVLNGNPLWSQDVRFEATVDDLNGNDDSVTFYLNAEEKWTDNTPPYDYTFDVAADLVVGENTLSAIAQDTSSYSSQEYEYTIYLVELPQWVLEFEDLGCLKLSFDTGALTYSIQFSKDLLEGKSGSTDADDAQGVGGETGLEASVEVEVKLSLSDGTTTIRGKGEIEAQLFKKGLTGSIELTGTFSGTFVLLEATISMHLELNIFEIPYKIHIPYIGDFGLTITGTPHIDISVTFEIVDSSFKPTSMMIKPGAELRAALQFGSLDGIFAFGVQLYAFVDGVIAVQIPDEPFLQIGLKFGVGAKYKAGPFSGDYPISWEWGYPEGYPKDPTGNVTWAPAETVGSNLTYGRNFVFSNLDFDDDPYVASDSSGNAIMVYVSNATSFQQGDIFYSFWNKTCWSEPEPVAKNTNYEMNPVVAFDSNDNAMAVWTYDKNGSLTRDSSFDDFISSVKDFEIYYSIWNKTGWSTPKAITNDACVDAMPSIFAGKNGHVMATWVHDYDANDTTKTDRDIFYSEWNGSAWSTPSAIANLAEADFNPNVAYDSANNAIVVWVHDSDSDASIFDDKPPVITNPDVNPNPGFVGQNVTISVAATDDRGVSRVGATINGAQKVDLAYNVKSNLYEGKFVPSIPGLYTVEIVANDTKGQTDSAMVTSEIEPPFPMPFLRSPNATLDVLYAGQSVQLSVEVLSFEPLYEVSAEIVYPSGFSEKINLIKGPGNLYLGVFTNTYQTGTYSIQYTAREMDGHFDNAIITIVVVKTGDQEIYFSTWNGTAWSTPSALTNNYYEDSDPSVGFDLNDNPIISFESYNGSNYEVYFTMNVGGGWRPFEKLSGPEWAMDPGLAVKNDVAMVTWRAYPDEWGDLYYRVFNTTFGGYDIGPSQRITNDLVTDWKQSVTLAGGNALVVWLKHKTTINANYTTYTYGKYTYRRIENFTMDSDDDDPYYTIIPILPDLTLDTLDIAFSNNSPAVNSTLTVKATVHNRGDIHILTEPTVVEFYDGAPAKNGTLIGVGIINGLMAGDQQTVQTNWTPGTYGVHDLYVVADAPNIIRESNEGNNMAYRSIPVSILTGNRTDKVETPYGNVTIRHSDDVLLQVGLFMVEAQFKGSGLDDYLFIEGNETVIAEVGGNITLVSALPSIQNVSFLHHTPAMLRVHDTYVEVFTGYGASNDRIIIPIMNSTREVTVEHSGALFINLTDQAVDARFHGNGTESISIVPMGASIQLKHGKTIQLNMANETDPQFLFNGTETQKSIDKFISTTANDTFDWSVMKIYYNESDLGGLNESDLKMFYWDSTAHRWTLIGNSGVNTTDNYVWANVTHFSIFTAIEHVEPHDVAVTNVSPLRTIVGQTCSCPINVTLTNHASYTETFNVTVYANTTSIAWQTVTLQGGSSKTMAFNWNTTAWSKGNYNVSAVADTVPGESDTTNNRLAGGWVKVVIVGDVNGDKIVDVFDLIRVAIAFGSEPGDPSWNPNVDLKEDNIIDVFDLIKVAIHFGETDP